MSTQAFIAAEDRLFERFGIGVERRTLDAPIVDGTARVLVAGEGPPVMMVIGAGPPAGIWAPLMAALRGYTLYAVDPPGMGLTSPADYTTETVRSTAVGFLDEVRRGLGLERPPFIAQSVGGLWSIWYALDHPGEVSALVLIACPALLFGNSAPLPLRLISVPGLGALLMRMRPPSPRQVDWLASVANEDFDELPEIRELWLQLERLPDSNRSLRSLIHANEGLRGARPQLQVTPAELAGLRAPVQFVWGEGDPVRASRSWAGRRPRSFPTPNSTSCPAGTLRGCGSPRGSQASWIRSCAARALTSGTPPRREARRCRRAPRSRPRCDAGRRGRAPAPFG